VQRHANLRSHPSAHCPIWPFDVGKLCQAANKVCIGMCLRAE